MTIIQQSKRKLERQAAQAGFDENIHGATARQGRGPALPTEREERPIRGTGIVLAVLGGIVAILLVVHLVGRLA